MARAGGGALVSTLTRSFDRVQRWLILARRRPVDVSTLTRSFDRVQLARFDNLNRPRLFQPSPDLSTGCNHHAPARIAEGVVSTLTRSFDRVQRPARGTARPILSFNPHPIFRPGATTAYSYRVQATNEFQPSPDLSTGCNTERRADADLAVFQPSPDLSTGCNARRAVEGAMGGSGFNPHPIFRPGATAVDLVQRVNPLLVSTLTRSFDRVQPGACRPLALLVSCFNSHPIFRPGATRVVAVEYAGPVNVSILTRSWDRVQRCIVSIRAPPLRFQPSPDLSTGCNL